MPRGSKTCPQCNTSTGPRAFKCPNCGHDYTVKGKSSPVPPAPEIPNSQSPPEPVQPPANSENIELSTTSMPYVMDKNKPLFDFRKSNEGRPLAIVKVVLGDSIQPFLSALALGKPGYVKCRTLKGNEIILGIEPVAA